MEASSNVEVALQFLQKCSETGMSKLLLQLMQVHHTPAFLVNVDFPHLLMAFGADVFVSLAEILLQIHVPAFHVLNQRALLDVERFAVGTAVTERNVRGATFWADYDFVEQCFL